METIQQLIVIVAVVTGTAFSVIGMIGFRRLPDVYTRLHATGKVAVFGVVLLLVAAVASTPLGWGRGLLLIFFLMGFGPITAHAISSAAYRLGVPMQKPLRDDLAVEVQEVDE